jgi:tetraacyldisaccharide 4'-kinase
VAALASARVLAFAGIGDPQKLFAGLASVGIAVARSRAFADHHRYTAGEALALCSEADRDGLTLVTTEKDVARMQGDAALTALAARARPFPVALTLADRSGFLRLLHARVASA